MNRPSSQSRIQNNLLNEVNSNNQVLPEMYNTHNFAQPKIQTPQFNNNNAYNSFTPTPFYNMPAMGYNMQPGFAQTTPLNQNMGNIMEVQSPYMNMTPQKPPLPPPISAMPQTMAMSAIPQTMAMSPQSFASPPSHIPGTGETNYSVLNNNKEISVNSSFESAETLNQETEGGRGQIGNYKVFL